MDVSNFTYNASTTIRVHPQFFTYALRNSMVNFLGTMTNAFVLSIGLTSKEIHGRNKMPSIYMSASNLMASFFPLSLNSFYFGFYLTDSKVNYNLHDSFQP
ncbi:hypothetical protein L596_010219 [Steinernema carpocapsae]|uniref:7TM GPCR serpentine receptor class x (Srx) domain-containing protein n=1 Tax=Steinernema carpocapsae TaxID=34508 RepID=A0A4U5PHW8_STECR|nr:hypothetical protein L596_010219 [Steinernema carpocapsae]